ncbi:MAG: ABC transporter permease [Armatimonadetes bacterium]|nr:ABC transporter permease [Armatimonadota bacterium]
MKDFLAVRGKLTPRVDLMIGMLGVLMLGLLWSAATYGGYVKPLFLPTPSAVWEALAEYHHKDWLLPAILRSTFRVVQALGLVILVGVPLGLLMGAFAPIDALFRKVVNGAKSVPTTGLVGLIVLWFSVEEKAKIVFLFLGALFYMIVLVRQAVLAVSQDYVNVALDIGAKRRQVLGKVLLPGALPQIWEAVAVCNGIMWTYIVLAEFINNSEEQLGLGYLLYVGSRTQDSGKVFATLIVVGIISAITDWAFLIARRRLFPW